MQNTNLHHWWLFFKDSKDNKIPDSDTFFVQKAGKTCHNKQKCKYNMKYLHN